MPKSWLIGSYWFPLVAYGLSELGNPYLFIKALVKGCNRKTMPLHHPI